MDYFRSLKFKAEIAAVSTRCLLEGMDDERDCWAREDSDPGPPADVNSALGMAWGTGHDVSVVPPVGNIHVVLTRLTGGGEPQCQGTWKAELGGGTMWLYAAPDWGRTVAARGWAILGNQFISAVHVWDDQGRPTCVTSGAWYPYFDLSMHGWRAYIRDCRRYIDWAEDGSCTAVEAWVRDHPELLAGSLS